MGQTPAKFFPQPLPYGASPDMGVLAQAKAAAPAPQQSFLPLNSPDPSQQQPQQQAPQMPSFSGFSNFSRQLPGRVTSPFRMTQNRFYD